MFISEGWVFFKVNNVVQKHFWDSIVSWQWVPENVGPSPMSVSVCTVTVSTPRPYLLQTNISMWRPASQCCPYLQTWAGSHFKTNILDIMYISDFYSHTPFCQADHETIESEAALCNGQWATEKTASCGIALNEPFSNRRVLQHWIMHFYNPIYIEDSY